LFKEEGKSTKQSQCQFGPDGKVQKTALGPSAAPFEKRGLKGRVLENKKEEMKNYMERLASLMQRYVPPDSSHMKESFQAGSSPTIGG